MESLTDIQILPATDADYPVMQNLSACYIYDFTEYLGWACPESGRFSGCDGMFAEWQAGKNYPSLVRVSGELAGFAAVGIDMAAREFYIQEFFILRKFRRQRVGRAVAHQLINQFAGNWRVELLTANTPARHFWPSVVLAYAPVLTEDRNSSWGAMQCLRFANPLSPDFPFADVGVLQDGELELHLQQTRSADLSRTWLPAYDFEMRVQGARVGEINLRVGNTVAIVLYAGHIGFGVEPDYRGRHFAERACRLLLPLARTHGLPAVWITTNPDNHPSRRTCERLGARLVEIVSLPEDDDQYAIGDREKCRYRINLG